MDQNNPLPQSIGLFAMRVRMNEINQFTQTIGEAIDLAQELDRPDIAYPMLVDIVGMLEQQLRLRHTVMTQMLMSAYHAPPEEVIQSLRSYQNALKDQYTQFIASEAARLGVCPQDSNRDTPTDGMTETTQNIQSNQNEPPDWIKGLL